MFAVVSRFCSIVGRLSRGLKPSSLGLALLTFLVSSCRPSAPDVAGAARVFSARGVVQELKPDGRTVVIRHEAISHYMEAMTMPFQARSQQELAGLTPGDEVRFQLHVSDEASWIDQIVKTGRAPTNEAQAKATATLAVPSSTNASAVATNKAGDFFLSNIPEFALTNEFGQPVRLQQFAGRAVALTFFFTRCPIPEFCPRLTRNFQGALDRLKTAPGGPTNVHFLSISFDPLDTPPLLRAYAQRYHYDSNHWSFITGKPEHVRELAAGFGVPVTPDGASYTHGFSTAIFDATGRLQILWPIGGDMTDHIVTEMTKAALAR